MMKISSRDTIVITVTHYGLDSSGFEPCEGKISHTHQDYPQCSPSLLHNGCQFSFLGVSSQGIALTTHPIPSSAKVKEKVKSRAVYLLHFWDFRACHRGTFTFYDEGLTP
jgi:hypothetical protein